MQIEHPLRQFRQVRTVEWVTWQPNVAAGHRGLHCGQCGTQPDGAHVTSGQGRQRDPGQGRRTATSSPLWDADQGARSPPKAT
jgi:hypothetical protein